MKVCPRCGDSHEKSGVYCSRRCANVRQHSEETKTKIRNTVRNFWDQLPEAEKVNRKELLASVSPRSTEQHLQNVLNSSFDFLSLDSKRLRVILEQEGKCNRCGISTWNGLPITLEYEHIDGNHQNNSRENVEALCPNCHSQTDTWRGRNNGKRQRRVEQYIDMVKSL